MDTFTVPCARCDEFRARFEAEGFTVLGCDSDPNKADMCVLKFERPTTIKAAVAQPVGAAGTSAVVRVGTAAKTTKTKSKAKAKAASSPAATARAASEQRRHVNVTALNLRSTPSASSSANVLRTLSLGQPVEIIGDQQSGWWPVRLTDGSERGFVKALIDDSNGIGTPSLRIPVDAAREALVAEAVRLWERFKFGQGKETVDPFFKMVGEMWAAIELPHDGRDDIPWSAAAISFMVRQAAASHAGYKQFKFAASHSKYIHDAIVNAGQARVPFHGFQLFEHKPQLGDLVARSREGAISFEQAAASDAFKSHTDIIVAIHADVVYAIGGNVSDSVSVARYPKTDRGHLSDAGGVFALLANKV
jgi:hypothetical protein